MSARNPQNQNHLLNPHLHQNQDQRELKARIATDSTVKIGTFLSEAAGQNANWYCLVKLNIA